MGLKKQSLRNDNAVKYDFNNAYYKILSFHQNGDNFIVSVAGYADKQASDSQPKKDHFMPHEVAGYIWQKTFQIKQADIPEGKKQSKSAIDLMKHCLYLYLKTTEEFSNSEDVIE
jgi:hypothetical protein